MNPGHLWFFRFVTVPVVSHWMDHEFLSGSQATVSKASELKVASPRSRIPLISLSVGGYMNYQFSILQASVMLRPLKASFIAMSPFGTIFK